MAPTVAPPNFLTAPNDFEFETFEPKLLMAVNCFEVLIREAKEGRGAALELARERGRRKEKRCKKNIILIK